MGECEACGSVGVRVSGVVEVLLWDDKTESGRRVVLCRECFRAVRETEHVIDLPDRLRKYFFGQKMKGEENAGTACHVERSSHGR